MSSALGEWNAENARGRAHADELLTKMITEDNPTYLGHECKRLIQAGQYGGFEVGFFHRIAEEAMV